MYRVRKYVDVNVMKDQQQWYDATYLKPVEVQFVGKSEIGEPRHVLVDHGDDLVLLAPDEQDCLLFSDERMIEETTLQVKSVYEDVLGYDPKGWVGPEEIPMNIAWDSATMSATQIMFPERIPQELLEDIFVFD